MFPPLIYLKKLKPFSFLDKTELNEIVDGLESEIFRKGEIIFRQGGKPLKFLYVLKSGRVALVDEKSKQEREVLEDGEFFGNASVVSSNPPKYTAIAKEDCVCYLISRDKFIKVFNSNMKFSDFFVKLLTKRLSSLLMLSKVSTIYEHLYAVPVTELISKSVVVCTEDKKIVDVARLMNNEKVGSVVVVEGEKAKGIFTQRDLARVVASGISLETSVGKHMSSPLISINSEGTVMEACLMMMSNGINHIVITENDFLKGVISSKDILLELETFSSLLSLSRRILSSEQDKIPEITQSILKSIEDITLKIKFSEVSRVASGMYDLITKRVIEKYNEDLDVDFCWSQVDISGRKELIFPEIHSLVIYDAPGDREIKQFIEKVEEKLNSAEFESDYLKIVNVRDLEEFVFSLDNDLQRMYDSRFFYGNKKFQEKFSDLLKERTEDAINLSARECIATKNDYLAIVSGVRSLALESGIYSINNTEERCKLLENDVPMIMDVLEAYRVITDTGMKKKFYHRMERIDEILLKESRKILSDFRKFIEDRYAVKGKI